MTLAFEREGVARGEGRDARARPSPRGRGLTPPGPGRPGPRGPNTPRPTPPHRGRGCSWTSSRATPWTSGSSGKGPSPSPSPASSEYGWRGGSPPCTPRAGSTATSSPNVRLDAEGRAVLVDLGFARPAGADEAPLGTPGYLAPERERGGAPAASAGPVRPRLPALRGRERPARGRERGRACRAPRWPLAAPLRRSAARLPSSMRSSALSSRSRPRRGPRRPR